MKAFCDRTPVEQRTADLLSSWRSLVNNLLDGLCVEATCFPRVSIGTTVREMHICDFPSTVIRSRYKTTKRVSNRMSITTSATFVFFLSRTQVVHVLSLRKQTQHMQTNVDYVTHTNLLSMRSAVLS
jgi:hypothetical protein